MDKENNEGEGTFRMHHSLPVIKAKNLVRTCQSPTGEVQAVRGIDFSFR